MIKSCISIAIPSDFDARRTEVVLLAPHMSR
jgi:hypothetical protein